MIDLTTPAARRAELIGVGILLLVVFGGTLWYMATHRAPVPYAAVPLEESPVPETIPPQVFEEHGQYYDVVATYPSETALKASLGLEADAAAVALMDEFVTDSIEEFMAQGNFEGMTPEEASFIGLTNDRKESIMIDYEEMLGSKTVSYVFTLFVDTLGAHPNAFYRTFTFDLSTGAELKIADLFVPRSEYLTRLSAIAEFELAKSLGETADIDYIRQGVTPDALNFQSFAVEGDNLLLVFPPYQVAPYSAGTQEVSIPLSQLAEILKPAYQQ